MTRNDYEYIASILNRLGTGLGRLAHGKMDAGTFRIQFTESFVPNIADELAEKNPRFDRDRFIKACVED